MRLHEYQAKALLQEYDIPIPQGVLASSAEQAKQAYQKLNAPTCLIKAQIHTSGRAKVGAIHFAKSASEAYQLSAELLGKRIQRPKAKLKGKIVSDVLVEALVPTCEELYLALRINRSQERLAFIGVRNGGLDIEEIRSKMNEKIHVVPTDLIMGLQPTHIRHLFAKLELDDKLFPAFVQLTKNLYRLFLEKDLLVIEINPLASTEDQQLIALDAKIIMDENALFRHPGFNDLHDDRQRDATEKLVSKYGMHYVSLDGDIACLVNGAGLAMATMDLIKLHGGDPANFLDVGSDTTPELIADALRLINDDHDIKAIFVNIFGGILSCVVIAEGIKLAAANLNIKIPIIARLQGNQSDEAKQIIRDSELLVILIDELSLASQTVVNISRGGR